MGIKLLSAGITIGILLVITGIAVFVFEEKFVRNLVIKSVQLIPSTDLYQNWLNPPIDIYMEIHLYSLKNADEYLNNGAKPVFEEIGPFVYKETRVKDNVRDNMNYTISYSDRRYYNFLPEKSKYMESYPITTVNLAAVTILNFIQNSSILEEAVVNFALGLGGENILVKKTAGEIIWGYEDPILSFLHGLLPTLVPDLPIGLLSGQNDTSYGQYTIYTGVDDISKVGVIEKFNYQDKVSAWSNKYANMINGTDGSISQPFVSKTERQYAFQSTLCRSLYGYYSKTVNFKDNIDLWVIAANATVFANATENPENEGFCVPAGNCLGAGVFDMSTCLKMGGIGVPLVMSNPHFLFADPKYAAEFEGIREPDENLDNTQVYLDPLTGVELKANQLLQFSAKLINDSRINIAKKIKPMYFPVMWVNENFEADDATLKKFYNQSKLPILIINILKYIVLVGGLVLFLLSILLLTRRIRNNRNQNVVSSENANTNENAEENQPRSSSANWKANETTPLLLN